MSKPKYVNTGLKLLNIYPFKEIHNCGSPTKNFPVNLYCNCGNGTVIYVALLFGKWSVEWTYDETINPIRSRMPSWNGIKTQKEMLAFVQRIIDGEFKTA